MSKHHKSSYAQEQNGSSRIGAIVTVNRLRLEKQAQEKLIPEYREQFPKVIPSGRSIQIHFWKEKTDGEKLHNRYILTDFAGVIFGTGLDESKNTDKAETDDLSLMTATQLDARWKN